MLDNKLPVMVHVWDASVPNRNQFVAPAVDDIAVEFIGKMDVVRSSGTA